MVLLSTLTPLNWYYSNVSENIRPLKLEQISGSAIKGSAKNASYLGMNLGQADWLIYPSSYNALTLDFSLKDKLYDIAGKFIKSNEFDSLKDVTGTFDWAMIDKFLNFNHGEMSGYVQLDFDQVEMRNNVPKTIIGKAVTKELQLVKPIKKDLGEIEVVFVSDNPSIIVGQVNSQSNVINVSGAIYIHKNHRWEIKLTLIPMPGEYEIEYAIQNIGDRRRGGGRSLNLAGFY
jgi:hypothetical protein